MRSEITFACAPPTLEIDINPFASGNKSRIKQPEVCKTDQSPIDLAFVSRGVSRLSI